MFPQPRRWAVASEVCVVCGVWYAVGGMRYAVCGVVCGLCAVSGCGADPALALHPIDH